MGWVWVGSKDGKLWVGLGHDLEPKSTQTFELPPFVSGGLHICVAAGVLTVFATFYLFIIMLNELK